MAKLFNNIRKKLVADKPSTTRTTNYLKYAIGEILLVVVGILIALQLNNLNDIRKTKNVELSLLNDVKVSLLESQKDLEKLLKNNSQDVKNLTYLNNYVIKNLPYNHKLDTIFASLPTWSSPYLTYTAYETLKSKGLDLIKNDSLKKQIINIYESDFAGLTGDWDRWEWNINQDIVMPFFADNIRRDINNLFSATPNNFEALKKNKKFLNILSVLLFTRVSGINRTKKSIANVKYLILAIDNELEKRNFKLENYD